MKGLMKPFSVGSFMWRKRITKRVYVGECAGSHSVGRPRKRWIDAENERLKEKVRISDKQGEWSRI